MSSVYESRMYVLDLGLFLFQIIMYYLEERFFQNQLLTLPVAR